MKEIKMLNGETKYFEETENGFIEVEKPKGRWLPKIQEHYANYYEDYYYVDSHNTVQCNIFTNCSFDNQLIRHNNLFKTKEEAERKKEIMDFIYDRVYNFSKE